MALIVVPHIVVVYFLGENFIIIFVGQLMFSFRHLREVIPYETLVVWVKVARVTFKGFQAWWLFRLFGSLTANSCS